MIYFIDMNKKIKNKIIIFIIFLVLIAASLLTFIELKDNNKKISFNEQIIKDEEIVKEEPEEINMIFFGDTMLGRSVEYYSTNDNNYPYEKIQDLIKEKQDIIYTNLEGSIMDPHFKTKSGSTVFSFPKYSVDVLKNNNFNLLSLANNHMQDYGINGYNQTQKFLKDNNIDYFGDYYNKENLYIKKNIKGKDFIFFGFNMINKDFEKDLDENKKNIIEEIKKIKEENSDAFIILFPHWGNEYKIKSNIIQQTFAHELIDSGANLIIGGHPHVTEEYEIYKGKYIFYSLGNFIFDQYFSINTQEMIAIKLKIIDEKSNIEIIPIKSINSQPEVITDEKEKKEFLDKYNLNLK